MSQIKRGTNYPVCLHLNSDRLSILRPNQCDGRRIFEYDGATADRTNAYRQVVWGTFPLEFYVDIVQELPRNSESS